MSISDLQNLIKTKSLESKHFPIILGALKELAKRDEDFKEEIEDIDDVKIQIIPTDTPKAWLKIEDGILTVGEGDIDDPISTIEEIESSWINIFIDPKEAGLMHMAGDVKVTGDFTSASTIFQDLVTAFLYALE